MSHYPRHLQDQGRSSYSDDRGTHHNSWPRLELPVGPSKDSGEKWRREVARSLHAHDRFKKRTIEISDGGLFKKAKNGDVLGLG
jgi:hypothetical protein